MFRNYSYHAVHYGGAGNTNTHHNIFDPRRIDSSRIEAEGQMPGGGSIITAYMYFRLITNAAGNLFRDNIIRNTNPPGSNYVIALDDNRVDVLNNVFINNKSIMISISSDLRFEMQIVIIIYNLSFRSSPKYNKYKILST